MESRSLAYKQRLSEEGTRKKEEVAFRLPVACFAVAVVSRVRLLTAPLLRVVSLCTNDRKVTRSKRYCADALFDKNRFFEAKKE